MTPLPWPHRPKQPKQTPEHAGPDLPPTDTPAQLEANASTANASGNRSLATGPHASGIASTGDHTTNIQAEHVTHLGAAGPRPVAQVPPVPGAIGMPGAGLFVGRTAELARLHTALTSTRDNGPATTGAPGVVVQALHGLGGIGKSTLAARYLELHAADYTQAVWITADSMANLGAGLASLATALEPELAGALPSEALRERAIGWLCSHTGWLVVLDNVTRPDDVRPLLGRATTGRFLLTSRQATGWHNLATPLHLDVLEPDEAHQLITRIVGTDRPDLLTGAEDLCEHLGYLPLAIEQAAAYLHQNQISASEYHHLLDRHPAVMLQQAAEGTPAHRTIAQIWAVTLDTLADIPLAGDLLRVLAWLAPDTIPRHYLDPLAEEPPLLEALGKLAAYNMITLGGGHLTVHRLVQTVSRTPDPNDPHRTPTLIDHARDMANTLLYKAFPGDPDDPATWPRWRELTPHIAAYAVHAPETTDTDTTSYLLDRTATYLGNQGNIPQAIHHFKRALHTAEHLYGTQHNTTLTRRHNLAHAYASNGDLTRAIPLYEQTLTDREQLLGPTHPDTLISRNNLATAYQDNGDITRAIPLYEQTLTDREQLLGPAHRNTLISRNNLATAYRANGDLTRATILYEQTLIDRERLLGPEHPDTLTSRNNLAMAYQDNGDLTRAIPLYEQTLTASERTLGPTHPTTKVIRGNLEAARRQTPQADTGAD